jgi:exosortase
MDVISIPSHRTSAAHNHWAFVSLICVSAIIFWRVLSALVWYSLKQESASHIIAIPFVSIFLLYTERRRIFSSVSPSFFPGAGLILLGGILYHASGFGLPLKPATESLSIAALALVFFWTGGFVCAYGLAATRAAAFPLLFLLLMVPLPDPALAWTINLLQQGSTDVTYLLFRFLGVPVLRQGFVLAVPTVTIEVAVECSGIRSSIALIITCLLAAHFYLRTPWKIVFFILLVLPLTVLKNGIRIATLTLLSIYVNSGFLHGSLHRDGGFVFFLIALLLLLPVLLLLQKSEHRSSVPGSEGLKQALP